MRSAGLDLLKWTAIVTMVADHLRYLWPAADGLFIVGRLAFPLFCLALAINVGRSDPTIWPSRSAARYLGWLLVFGVLSEGPYRWLDNGSQTLNVIPTLTLGLLLAWATHHRQTLACLLGLSAALTAAWYSDYLMYGLPGVLLPAAILIARRFGGASWLLPCALAVAGNMTNSWLGAHPSEPIALVILSTAALSLPIGLCLARQERWQVPRVGRWGYAFYPLHLALIGGLQRAAVALGI
nr:TraX family protein [uncultured Pseudomonas sp.]